MTARLDDRWALVTGSTSGIGAATARLLAARGARVIVTGRDAGRGKDVVAGIKADGGAAVFVRADLGAGPAAVTALATEATELAGGPLDVLVNNAAQLIPATATPDTPAELIGTAFTVSVAAPFLLTAALVPAMAARGRGAVVNVGSINGLVGMAGAALYGATKAALHSLTKSWAAEFGPAGVRVNTVAPGPTRTEWNEQHAEFLEQLATTIPSRRLSSTDEVAAAVAFLAGDDAANIHGATLSVDGGFAAL